MKITTLSELFNAYSTGETGLSREEAKRRLAANGPNTLPVVAGRSLRMRLAEQFTHFFALLLWAAAAISFLSGWIDPSSGMGAIGWAIVIVIVLNGIFGFYQEYRTEKSLDALRKILPQRVRVRRGTEEIVSADDLVHGDLVLLREGDKVPADVYVIKAVDLWVNESTLSGESEAVFADVLGGGYFKTELYSGTYVVKGEGEGIVFATGKESRYGMIALLTQKVEPGIGHLQKEIARISKVVALISSAIALSFIVMAGLSGFELWKTFLFALGVLVAMIPEGLLPTVTLALAFGAQRMASKGFLVNGLSVIENLGAVSVIATDKTGTLTQNTMEVAEWFEEGSTSVSEALIEGALLCNRAGDDYGDPIERALLRFASGYTDAARLRGIRPMEGEYPFDYHLKRMSTVHRSEYGFVILCKGAPEVLLQLCGFVQRGEEKIPLTQEVMDRLLARHDAMASSGYRVIAFARNETQTLPLSRNEAEKGLVFVGFIAMVDPLREDIVTSVEVCRKAGIRVMMLTGDHPVTAGAIGVQSGIIPSAEAVTSGEELERLPVSALKRLLRKNHVFARVTPEQKLRIVTLLKEMGETVAVTGDGVNDAPALKKADVGISMGSGTDVAKNASDAVLIDDHFATIVRGIEEGRAVYENIRRFITYMLASNLPEAVPYILFFWLGIPLALPVPLVLAIDLGTDIMPGLALGTEHPHEGLMHQGPRSRKEPILTLQVYARAFGYLGVISAIVAMGMFWIYLKAHGWDGRMLDWHDPLYLQATTLAFAVIVFAQIGNGLSCRSQRESLWKIGWWSNRYYWGGVGVELAVMVVLIFVPSVSKVFGTMPFEPLYWIGAMGAMMIVLAAEEIRKRSVRVS